MPRHNGGFYVYHRCDDNGFWLLWSDYADYKHNERPEMVISATPRDNIEGQDFVDDLIEGRLDERMGDDV